MNVVKNAALSAAIAVVFSSSASVSAQVPPTGQPGSTSTSAMPDSDMDAVLKAHATLNPKPIEKIDVATARKNPTIADAVAVRLKQNGKSSDPTTLVPGVMSKDSTVTGAVGDLPSTVYTPVGKGPFPVVLYFHGGGWVIANRKVYDGGARGLAKEANAVVVSVDYRLAPENKFPAAWEDALASYKWVLANAAKLNADPKRVALAGESAGGNLALATSIAVRDAHLQPPLHVVAIYPITQTSTETDSYNQFATAKPLNRDMMKWFMDKTIRSPADLKDHRLQLVDADLRGLPPVTLINAQIDPLDSDGALMESALRKAGVAVERKEYAGVTHEFFGTAAVVEKAKQAQGYAGQRLKAAFSDAK